MSVSAYLHFTGNCKEVFDFYKSIFGGDYVILQTFRDGPPEMGVPEAELDNVMHVTYQIGDSVLMGSDMPSNFPMELQHGNSFSLSYETDSREETDRVHAALSDGGVVSMPLSDMFWGAYFGTCTDKYGINWMIDCHAAPSS